MPTFPFDPLGLVDQAVTEAAGASSCQSAPARDGVTTASARRDSDAYFDDRPAVVSKYERTELDGQAEQSSEAWWTENER